MLNSKSKAMTLLRAGERLVFNPGALEDLQDGDVVDIVTGLPLRCVDCAHILTYTYTSILVSGGIEYAASNPPPKGETLCQSTDVHR